MRESINDQFSVIGSVVRFEPTVSIRFLAEELRRYGIKTNSTNDKGKTIFYQSAHLVLSYDDQGDDGLIYPRYTLASFKDLFKIIGKNDEGADEQDIVRTWYIAEKLEKRSMLRILGTNNESIGEDDKPNLPDVYANLHHIHRNDKDRENYIYKSKFSTNKAYKTTTGQILTGVADYFILG